MEWAEPPPLLPSMPWQAVWPPTEDVPLWNNIEDIFTGDGQAKDEEMELTSGNTEGAVTIQPTP